MSDQEWSDVCIECGSRWHASTPRKYCNCDAQGRFKEDVLNELDVVNAQLAAVRALVPQIRQNAAEFLSEATARVVSAVADDIERALLTTRDKVGS